MRSLKIASLIGWVASGFGMSISNPGASNQHTSPIFHLPSQETKSRPNKISQAKRRKYKRQGRL
ncbi:hypothetical protein [Acinetobacter sp. NyZ410]|uniref:hypothetical protein n=1 Tax=Acinetobacter sp. NyZ410 TaxID=2929509 RepID=UPI001FBBDB51|nr:hypothetical protein [Acinetobacter sp. NyZ410]UOH19881.1 hypothetical protein MTO68_06960 [Acinetobacter sp. NyZ410]